MPQTKTIPVETKRSPRVLAGVLVPKHDSARQEALALYETAIRLMQEGKYEAAHKAFNEMLLTSPGEMSDRIRMYIAACVKHISKGAAQFQSQEERYDYAVSLLNTGHYEDAREHFEAILVEDKQADYAFYGLAVLSSMTGSSNHCLDHLSEAIRLNARNRIQARADSDFQDMADDPRFTELLYPEA